MWSLPVEPGGNIKRIPIGGMGRTTLVTHRPLVVSRYTVKASREGARSSLSTQKICFCTPFFKYGIKTHPGLITLETAALALLSLMCDCRVFLAAVALSLRQFALRQLYHNKLKEVLLDWSFRDWYLNLISDLAVFKPSRLRKMPFYVKTKVWRSHFYFTAADILLQFETNGDRNAAQELHNDRLQIFIQGMSSCTTDWHFFNRSKTR